MATDAASGTSPRGPVAYGGGAGVGRPPLRPNLHICAQLWNGPQVDYDGELLGCCTVRDPWGAGNVFASGAEAVINGDKLRRARAMVLGRGKEHADIPCADCHRYRWMKRHEVWVSLPKVVAAGLMVRVRRRLPGFSAALYTRLHGAALRLID